MTGAHYVREVQYRTEDNFLARQSIYRFLQPRVDIWSTVLDLAELSGEESVLDAGCGNGAYLATLERRGHQGLVAGVDLSPGMLDAATTRAPGTPLVIGDVAALPCRDGSFDVVLAMHMLYHLPDRALGIRELRRVVRDDGVVLVVTNGDDHLRELDEVAEAAAGSPLPRMTFRLESGEPELRASFQSVERHDMPGELVVTEVEPLVDYVASKRAFVTGQQLPPVLEDVRRRVADVIGRDGAFRIHTHAGCFVCRS